MNSEFFSGKNESLFRHFVFILRQLLPQIQSKMTTVIRNNITDHPYALQTWDGPFPFLLPGPFQGEGEADVLRIRAPKSYWLYLEGQTQEQVEILRRDLNGSNGLPPLGESFQARVRKSLNTLKKMFLDTDWRIKGKFKDESMFVSIKRHDFLPGTSMEFPRFITPPPPYGARPSPNLMKEHFPNCLPFEDEEDDDRRAASSSTPGNDDRLYFGGGGSGDHSVNRDHHHHQPHSPGSPFVGCRRGAASPNEIFRTTTPPPTTTTSGDVPLVGCESIFTSETRIKTEFGTSEYRHYRSPDFSNGINY